METKNEIFKEMETKESFSSFIVPSLISDINNPFLKKEIEIEKEKEFGIYLENINYISILRENADKYFLNFFGSRN